MNRLKALEDFFAWDAGERVKREINDLERIARAIYGDFSDDAERREFRRRAWILLAALSKRMEKDIKTRNKKISMEPVKQGLEALFNGFEKYQRRHKDGGGAP